MPSSVHTSRVGFARSSFIARVAPVTQGDARFTQSRRGRDGSDATTAITTGIRRVTRPPRPDWLATRRVPGLGVGRHRAAVLGAGQLAVGPPTSVGSGLECASGRSFAEYFLNACEK